MNTYSATSRPTSLQARASLNGEHVRLGLLGTVAVLADDGLDPVRLDVESGLIGHLLAVRILVILDTLHQVLAGGLLVVKPQVLVDLVLVGASDVGESLANVRHGGVQSDADVVLEVIALLVQRIEFHAGSGGSGVQNGQLR